MNSLFEKSPVMAILRGLPVEDTVRLANTAWDHGIELVEVPIQDESSQEALSAVVRSGQARGNIAGAGTVTSVEKVTFAHHAGAAFTVAPGMDPEVVQASLDLKVPHLPGVATPTDVQNAQRMGLTWVKAFPASVLGVDWFRAMTGGPFPQMRFVATGGMDAHNAHEFLQAGAKCVAIGSALADPEQLEKLGRLVQEH